MIQVRDGLLVIGWPAPAGEMMLESSETIGEGGVWVPVAHEPELKDGRMVVMLPVAGEARFYRLRSP